MIIHKIYVAILIAVLAVAQAGGEFTPPPTESLAPPPDGGLDKDSFSQVLADISECLDEDRSENISDLITYDFLHSITNAEFQPLALPYTRKWAAEYGEQFPESFLLHCLAGGDVAAFTNQYDSLTNLVSRNCIRWCLMVQGVPLEEPTIQARRGAHFKNDRELWLAIPATVKDGESFSKNFYLRKRGLIYPVHQIIGHTVVVSRDDGIPVPWGNSMYPDMDRFPHIAPEQWIKKKNVSEHPVGRKRFQISAPPVRVKSDVLWAGGHSRTWRFFAKVHSSPFVFLAGQAIATTSENRLEGNFHYMYRVLVAKNGFRKHPMENAEQDLIITLPIHFQYFPDDPSSNIIFSWAGKIEHIKSRSFEEALEEARKGLPPLGYKERGSIILKRVIIRGAAGIILLAGLILLLKKRGVNNLSADEKKHERIGVIAAGLASCPVIGFILFHIRFLYSFSSEALGIVSLIVIGILIFAAPLAGMILGIKGYRQKAYSRKLPILALISNAGWLVLIGRFILAAVF